MGSNENRQLEEMKQIGIEERDNLLLSQILKMP